MGVRLTDRAAVAMYDSVTGQAFGPVFASLNEADEFLSWLVDKEEANDGFNVGDDYTKYTSDTRKFTQVQLMEAYLLWQKDTGRYEEPQEDTLPNTSRRVVDYGYEEPASE